MTSLKKFNGTTWDDSKVRKLGTSTDTITTLPADLYADGTNATVGLVGNMQQTGSPTPQNPIQPSECGDLETSGTKAGQYKIPISSASTTTPVYLGQVQSMRKIKKLVVTGEESTWTASGEAADVYYVSLAGDEYKGAAITTVCTHFKSVRNATNYLHLNNGEMCLYNGAISSVHTAGFKYPNSSLSDFKAYLAQQYANGTPVTIWYVLATETTGILNEPLRKIGDYADTVSGITIPTITGKDSFDVLTTLKPSEVSLAYTGWHDASIQEWDGSQWQ